MESLMVRTYTHRTDKQQPPTDDTVGGTPSTGSLRAPALDERGRGCKKMSAHVHCCVEVLDISFNANDAHG